LTFLPSIGSEDEYRALDDEYPQLASRPDLRSTHASPLVLVSQSVPTDYSATPPLARISVPVCYSFQIIPFVGSTDGPPIGTEFVTAVLGLRNPSTKTDDLADPSMWGLISIKSIQQTNTWDRVSSCRRVRPVSSVRWTA
jgi:hypothetical protein